MHFEIEGVQYSAKVVSSIQRQKDIGVTHQLDYVSGGAGQEWVHLDVARQLLSDQFGHISIPYILASSKAQGMRHPQRGIAFSEAGAERPLRATPTPTRAPQQRSRSVQTDLSACGASGRTHKLDTELAAAVCGSRRQHASAQAFSNAAAGPGMQSPFQRQDEEDSSSMTTLPPRHVSDSSQPSAPPSAQGEAGSSPRSSRPSTRFPPASTLQNIVPEEPQTLQRHPHAFGSRQPRRSSSPMQAGQHSAAGASRPSVSTSPPPARRPPIRFRASSPGQFWSLRPAPSPFFGPATGLKCHAARMPLAPEWSALQPPSSLPEPFRTSGFITALLARDACGRLEP